MKVLMVSDAGSIHTRRWAVSLKEAGVDIVLFSITPAKDDFYAENGVKVYVFDLFRYKKEKKIPLVSPLFSHVRAVRCLKSVVAEEKPDILHAHYATSYGLVAALAGFHPLIVSVWGSDVYEFPKLSALNRQTVRYILGKADLVLSTSRAMARETRKYYKGIPDITPFGVDTELFVGRRDRTRGDNKDTVVFGTVKTLSGKYGIDLLIRAFAGMRRILEEKYGHDGVPETELLIAGSGPDLEMLKTLACDLGVAGNVRFVGAVPHGDVPAVYAEMDVAVFLSREESFGVSAVEAMSCSVPVIASDADGFREILDGGEGIIVPRENAEAAAEAMAGLAMDREARLSYAKAGREKVEKCYRWRDNVAAMIGEYMKVSEKCAGIVNQ